MHSKRKILTCAVENSDVKKVDRWVKSWARVQCVKGDRRLLDVARARGNRDIIRLLENYEQINEFVCATFACDLVRIVEKLALGGGGLVDIVYLPKVLQ